MLQLSLLAARMHTKFHYVSSLYVYGNKGILSYLMTTAYHLHTWNQSMVQQLMSEGNIRRRLRNASPMGLIASTM